MSTVHTDGNIYPQVVVNRISVLEVVPLASVFCFCLFFVQKGVFPSNFVTMVDESASTLKANDNNNGAYALANNNVTSADQAPELPPKPVREYARVVFPYATAQPDELELKECDVITILSKDCEDKGWWKGELNNKVTRLVDLI